MPSSPIRVTAISFVGSTPIARYIYETGTRNGKRVQALGGAKNHMIVLPDADLDLAADAAVSAGYGSAGERCMAISAVVAVGDAGDPLIEGVQARIEKLKVGPGDEPGVEMGPLVTRAHLDKVRGYVDAGVADGAALVADGRDLVVEGHEDGFFLGPTLFDRVTTGMSIYTRRDLWPGPLDGPDGSLRGGDLADQPEPLRERHGCVHQRRWGRPQVPIGDPGGDGGNQRPDPGPALLLQLWGLEGLDLREPCHLWAPRASTSTAGRKWSSRGGPTRFIAASTSGSPPTGEATLNPRLCDPPDRSADLFGVRKRVGWGRHDHHDLEVCLDLETHHDHHSPCRLPVALFRSDRHLGERVVRPSVRRRGVI